MAHVRQHDHSLVADGSPIAVAGVPGLDVAKIVSGRFGMPRMPDGIATYILTAQGAGADPAYAVLPAPDVGGLYGMNVETLAANKTLTVGTDEIYQYLNPNGLSRTITLSTVGASAGDRFIIRQNGAYDGGVNDVLRVRQNATVLDDIFAGAIKEFIFDGTNWISRGIGTGEDDDKRRNITIGYLASGYKDGTAIGYDARGYDKGVAIGKRSYAYDGGAAVGMDANASNKGAAVGYGAEADHYGVAIGYVAHGDWYSVAIGYMARADSDSTALGFLTDTNDKKYGIALGSRSECYRTAETAVNINGGDSAQKNNVTQGRWAGTTTDGVAVQILLGAQSGKRFTIRDKSALAFKGIVVASTEATVGVPNVTSSWKVEGLIKKDADGNTTMVGVAHAVIAQDGGAAAWNAVFSASGTNLILTVTGAAATTIQWAARIDGVETVW